MVVPLPALAFGHGLRHKAGMVGRGKSVSVILFHLAGFSRAYCS